MANNHGCINNSLDSVNYSSPVPAIGLYIAGASAACLVMMLWDIGVGIKAKKRWLPCKLFKLNSITLTLLGIVAKLPVDLTTPMPSRHDQLSKLTGTVIICISMGFLVPSLGASNESECQTNMIALSIFVITVAVNIIIQLRTHVIVLFFKEHIIILCLMLLLLMLLWHISLNIKSSKRLTGDQYKDLLAKGNDSMFGRLKLCYLYSYCSNPQFTICKNPMYASISIVCLMCSVILIQATIRSVILKKVDFCSGAKDYGYGWSMPFVTITQNLTVIVGTLAIVFRWLALFSRMEFEKLIVNFWADNHVTQRNQTLGWRYTWQNFLVSLYTWTETTIQLLIVTPFVLVRILCRLYKHDILEDFKALHCESIVAASEYIVRKSVDDIIKFKDICSSVSLKNRLQLLPRASGQQMQTRGNNYPDFLRTEKRKVCSLSLALLVKVAQVSIPKDHFESLPKPSKEAYEIIYFIDRTLQTKSSDDNNKLSYAKAVLTSGDFSCLLSDDVTGSEPDLERAVDDVTGIEPDLESAVDDDTGIESDLERAVAVIKKLRSKLESDEVFSELRLMVDFINPQRHSSIRGLRDFMEQMFVDMIRALFIQLPIAIYKSLSECSAEEFEENVQVAMKFLFLTQLTGPREDEIDWSFPPAADFSSFITDNTQAPSEGPLERLREL